MAIWVALGTGTEWAPQILGSSWFPPCNLTPNPHHILTPLQMKPHALSSYLLPPSLSPSLPAACSYIVSSLTTSIAKWPKCQQAGQSPIPELSPVFFCCLGCCSRGWGWQQGVTGTLLDFQVSLNCREWGSGLPPESHTQSCEEEELLLRAMLGCRATSADAQPKLRASPATCWYLQVVSTSSAAPVCLQSCPDSSQRGCLSPELLDLQIFNHLWCCWHDVYIHTPRNV